MLISKLQSWIGLGCILLFDAIFVYLNFKFLNISSYYIPYFYFWLINIAYLFLFWIVYKKRFRNLINEGISNDILCRVFRNLFIVSLIAITFLQVVFWLMDSQFWISFYLSLLVVAILSGMFLFWLDNDNKRTQVVNQLEKIKFHSNIVELLKKYINDRIILIIFLFFVVIKVSMILYFGGSYIDEYNHIFSGIEIFNNGQLAVFNQIGNYWRGLYVSIMTGLFLKVFGQSILVAKLVPLIIGLFDFYFLYKISKKVLKNKYTQAFVLFVYTISPLIIFNHFYIRLYVFYEFFALGILFSFINLDKSIKHNRKQKVVFYGVIFVALNIICGLASFDLGANFILLISGILLIYLYFSYRFNELLYLFLPINNLISRFFNSAQNKILFFTATGLIMFWELNIPEKVHRLVYGSLSYGAKDGSGYYNLFFIKNGIWTILVLCTLLMITKIRNTYQRLLIIICLSIFFVCFSLNPQTQVTRVLLFFIPIYYLTVVMILENNKIFNNINKIIISILLLINIFINYPKDFFVRPSLPNGEDRKSVV